MFPPIPFPGEAGKNLEFLPKQPWVHCTGTQVVLQYFVVTVACN